MRVRTDFGYDVGTAAVRSQTVTHRRAASRAPQGARLIASALVLCAASLVAPPAGAQAVAVDGLASEWFGAPANAANLGIVRRNATLRGEYVWNDRVGDARTDLATPEDQADITRVQYSGTPTGLAIFVRLASATAAGDPVQVQVAIDTNRVAGSGQQSFAGFAETDVSDDARWEFLVQTHLSAGGLSVVLNTMFMPVATVMAARGADGIEIFVPWAAISSATPPSALPPTQPIRFTVATFREALDGNPVDVGGLMGATTSDALDVVSDCGNPGLATCTTIDEVTDRVVGYSADVHFNPLGQVYAPLVVQRYVANSPAATSDEWIEVRNVSPNLLTLPRFKLGDEETVGGTEGMYNFPAGTTLAPGGSFTVAASAAQYAMFFGTRPDAEFAPSDPAVADMIRFVQWSTGTMPSGLGNTGDQILLLDPSNTILDVATYGDETYPGVVTRTPAPGSNELLTRNAVSVDTDDNAMDFTSGGLACFVDGGICLADGGVDAGVDVALDVPAVDVPAVDVPAVDVPVGDTATDTLVADGSDVVRDAVADARDGGGDVPSADGSDDAADAESDAGEEDAQPGEDVATADGDPGFDSGVLPFDAGSQSDAARLDTRGSGLQLSGGGACACSTVGVRGRAGNNGGAALLGAAGLGVALATRRRRRRGNSQR